MNGGLEEALERTLGLRESGQCQPLVNLEVARCACKPAGVPSAQAALSGGKLWAGGTAPLSSSPARTK